MAKNIETLALPPREHQHIMRRPMTIALAATFIRLLAEKSAHGREATDGQTDTALARAILLTTQCEEDRIQEVHQCKTKLATGAFGLRARR